MKETERNMKDKDKAFDQEEIQLRTIFEVIKSLGRCTSAGLAVLDVEKKCFVCVTEHFLQMTNSNIDVLKTAGYHWFDRTFDSLYVFRAL